MTSSKLTDSKNCSRPENRSGDGSQIRTQQMRHMTMLARIDARIESDDLAAARRLLNYLNKDDPENAFINEQIAATAELLQDWQVLLRALTSLINNAQQDDEIDDLVFRCAQLLVEQLNRTNDAVTLIRDHFNAFINYPNSAQWAKEHLLGGPYRQVLLNIARTHIVQPLESPKNINVFNALGTWYAARPDEYRSAFQWYRKTLRIMPGNPEAIDGLISLHQ